MSFFFPLDGRIRQSVMAAGNHKMDPALESYMGSSEKVVNFKRLVDILD